MVNMNEFFDYVSKAGSPFHTVIEAKKLLEQGNFKELPMLAEWDIHKEGKYFVEPFPSMLIAFRSDTELSPAGGFKVAAAHGDSPCLRIKPQGEMEKEGYLKLNVEVYGGPILNTWMDRPLSVAGKVVLKSEHIFIPEVRYIHVEKSILTIPNLAIHMNKEVNKGIELNRQTDMLPLAGLLKEEINKDSFFIDYLAEQLHTDKENILDFDLSVFVNEKPKVIGFRNDFVSGPRLDNLTSVYAAVKGIIDAKRPCGINIAVIFDNEEIGSRTKQGAESDIFKEILLKIAKGCGWSHEDYLQAVQSGFLISADVSHGFHPNKPDKNDPTHIAVLGQGVVIKINAAQKYLTDSEAVAIFQQLCHGRNIPYQKFVNRSDETSGTTLGPILSARVPFKGVDVGVPLLAMHSARELMGTEDMETMYSLMQWLFEVNVLE